MSPLSLPVLAASAPEGTCAGARGAGVHIHEGQGMGLSGLAVFGDQPLICHLGMVSNGCSLPVQTLLRV